MVSRCNIFMGFRKYRESKCKKCSRRRGLKGREIGIFFKKAKRWTKKAINSDIGKFAVSQELAYAPKFSDLGASKIKNKKLDDIMYRELPSRWRKLDGEDRESLQAI